MIEYCAGASDPGSIPWKTAKLNAEKLCARVFGLKKYAVKACSSCRKGKFKCDDTRPCKRCVKRGCGDTCCDSDEIDNGCRGIVTSLAVERPLRFSDVSVNLEHARERPGNRPQFRFMQVHRLWQGGFNQEHLKDIFERIPHPIQDVVAEAFDAMTTLMLAKMGSMPQLPPSHKKPNMANIITAEGEAELNLMDHAGMAEGGRYHLQFDERLQNCTTISCNSTMANLVGGHREEVLSRFANCDVPVPSSELEFLCSVLYDSLHSQDPTLTQYIRWSVNALHARGQPVLIRWTRKREFHPVGGVHKMVNVFTPVTEAEYDNGMVRNPESCRPFSMAMGDFRNGRQCLASHDIEKRITLAQMARTPEGCKILNALSAEVAKRFAPMVAIAKQMRQARAGMSTAGAGPPGAMAGSMLPPPQAMGAAPPPQAMFGGMPSQSNGGGLAPQATGGGGMLGCNPMVGGRIMAQDAMGMGGGGAILGPPQPVGTQIFPSSIPNGPQPSVTDRLVTPIHPEEHGFRPLQMPSSAHAHTPATAAEHFNASSQHIPTKFNFHEAGLCVKVQEPFSPCFHQGMHDETSCSEASPAPGCSRAPSAGFSVDGSKGTPEPANTREAAPSANCFGGATAAGRQTWGDVEKSVGTDFFPWEVA
mmetsp:Transcript_10618/g.21252  ORF Transcript_10618/g.21252 Transcript_10618/m.21252 type:complete len:646 (+) Transcript_10618:46-1983(+)